MLAVVTWSVSLTEGLLDSREMSTRGSFSRPTESECDAAVNRGLLKTLLNPSIVAETALEIPLATDPLNLTSETKLKSLPYSPHQKSHHRPQNASRGAP